MLLVNNDRVSKRPILAIESPFPGITIKQTRAERTPLSFRLKRTANVINVFFFFFGLSGPLGHIRSQIRKIFSSVRK